MFRVVLSDLLARQGQRNEALVEAQIAAERAPDSSQAVGHLAHVLQLTGDLEQSERIYLRAIEMEPSNGHLRQQLAAVQERLFQDHAV